MNSQVLQDNYRVTVEKIFNNWQNLRLAIEHGMGGKNGQQVAIDIMNYVYECCIGSDITQGELQDIIEDLMDQELNTICEDGSVSEICRHLLRYKQMIVHSQYAEIELELNSLPQEKEWLKPDVKVAYKANASDSSTEDDNDSDDGESSEVLMDIEEDMDVEQPSASGTKVPAKKREHNFVEPEDGWTTVRSRRK